MSPFTLVITVCILSIAKTTNAATLSIRVDSSDIETYAVGSTVDVQVGTRVLLLSQMDCVWEWEIENMNSHALTSEISGVVRLLHIVPYTREEAGVYRCVYFNTEYNITLVAGRSNLFRRYGASSIEGVRNNSVILLTTDIQISCIQSEVLANTGGYWRGPNGTEVGVVEGSVYAEIIQAKGEAVLYVRGSEGVNVAEGVYTCVLDNGDEYRALMYRDEYAIVRESGERERLGEGVEVRYVGVGEEVSLVCPRDSIPEYLGDNEGNIIKLIQTIYIPLFTLNEAGVYQCRSERVGNHLQLVATGSALLRHERSKLSLLGNNSVLVVSANQDGSVVCAGSASRNGTGSTWYYNEVPVPVSNGSLVQFSSELGGLQFDLSKLPGTNQGEYTCVAGTYNGTGQAHTIAVYLEELQLELVTDTGVIINNSNVIFLHSRNFRSVTCRSAEFYPTTVSVNWTSTPAAYSRVNMGTLDLSGITASGMYTCTAASRYSTGSTFLYILLDNVHTNLTLTYNNRTVEFSNSEIRTLEIEVGNLNVTIECLGFSPKLILPTGASYTAAESSIQKVGYTVEVLTPAYNGLVSCTGVAHETTSVRLKAVGVALVGRVDGRVSTLNTGVSVVGKIEDFQCIGSDLNETSGWKESNSSKTQSYLRMDIYQEIFRFTPGVTAEGFYTCQARNETGGLEEITRGLFYSQPYGPSLSILVNGSDWKAKLYTLNGNNSVSVECNSNSYPLPLSTLWYQNITQGPLSNSSRLNLTPTQQNISLTCVVRTVFAINQRSLTIVNPFFDKVPTTMEPNQTNLNITNYTTSSNITLAQSSPPVYIVLTTLIIVTIVPCIVFVVSVIVHNLPANVKKHAKKWYEKVEHNLIARRRRRREETQDETSQRKYLRFNTNRENYKKDYGFDEVEEAYLEGKVRFWEPRKIRAEYEDMITLANVTSEMDTQLDEPVRITSEVEIKDDLKREAVERQKNKINTNERATPSISTQSPSRPGTPDTQIPDTDSHKLLISESGNSEAQQSPAVKKVEKEKEKGWNSQEQSHLLINIQECPDFIIVKGPYIKKARKWGKRKRVSKDPEMEKKKDYLDFLFEKDAEDVVIIAYQPENSSLKRSEIVFYPQGPKDKEIKIKIDNETEYRTKTKSYFSSHFYTMRQVVITNTKKNETREIRLFHFLTWPKVEVGSQTYPFIEFVRALRCKKQNPIRKKSIVLHCDLSHRSATFISIYYLQKRIERNRDFNLVKFFCEIKEQSKEELFPTYTQYEFLHAIILDLTLNDTTCQSSELDTKFKPLFGRARDCIPRREGRVGLFMEELEMEEKEANKTRAQIQEERDQGLQNLEDRFQRRQRKRAEKQKNEKEKERKGKKIEGVEEMQFGLVKQEDSFISDDEIEYIDNQRQFVPTLSGLIKPEPLYIKPDPAVDRYRKEAKARRKQKRQQNQKTETDKSSSPARNRKSSTLNGGETLVVSNTYQRLSQTEESNDPAEKRESKTSILNKKLKETEEKLDTIKDTEKEFKQLQMFRPHLLHTFAHPPLYTNYRTHKKHVTGSRDEEVKELADKEKITKENKEKNPDTKKGVKTNRRVLSLEEKLSQDECTRFEQFTFGERQTQVYGPNLVEENQAQGFWIHSLYGDEIVATRHPCVNDFEFANFNHPQFNLHLYKQEQIPTVVVLCTFEELIEAYVAKKELKHINVKRNGRQTLTPYWPPVGEEENFGPFKVKTESSEVFDDDKVMQWYELTYKDTKDLDEHSVRLFLCKDWDTLMEVNHTTLRHDRFVHFVTSVLAYTKQTRSDKIAIHCSDVKPYSSLFSAVFYALRQAESEGKIDMYHIAKGIQMSRRPSSVFLHEDQYFLSLKLTSDCLLNVAKARKEMLQEL